MGHSPRPTTPLPPYVPPKASSPAIVEYVPDSDDEGEASTHEVDSVAGTSNGPQVRTHKSPNCPAQYPIKFQPPVSILEQHWSRNRGPRPPASHGLPPGVFLPQESPRRPLLTPSMTSPHPAPTDLRKVHPIPARAITVNDPTTVFNPARPQATPVPLATPAPPHVPSVAMTPSPIPVEASPTCLLVNQPFYLSGKVLNHRLWPDQWRRFLEIARAFALNDLLFDHGFPSSFMLKNQAGEALSDAWQVYNREHPDQQLDRHVCELTAPPYDH